MLYLEKKTWFIFMFVLVNALPGEEDLVYIYVCACKCSTWRRRLGLYLCLCLVNALPGEEDLAYIYVSAGRQSP